MTLHLRDCRGFSALEMIAVLAAMAVISAIAIFSYDQSNSRGIALSRSMNEYANALGLTLPGRGALSTASTCATDGSGP